MRCIELQVLRLPHSCYLVHHFLHALRRLVHLRKLSVLMQLSYRTDPLAHYMALNIIDIINLWGRYITNLYLAIILLDLDTPHYMKLPGIQSSFMYIYITGSPHNAIWRGYSWLATTVYK